MHKHKTILINDREVDPIGFGCGPLGVHGFGEIDLAECRRAVEVALDKGVSFFDTSDAYGKGESETQLAKALGNRRQDAFITTKGGIRFMANGEMTYENSIDYLQTALDLSLKRLNTDFVELYQLHYWDKITPIDEIFSFFESLVKQGKIGSYGVSNLDLRDKKISFFEQFPNFLSHSEEFSLVQQKSSNQFKAMVDLQKNAIFLATGVLAQGLLSGKYRAGDLFGENDRRKKNNYTNFDYEFMLKASKLIEALSGSAYPPVALATAWCIRQAPQIVALVGIKSPKQLNEILEARTILNSNFNWAEIDSEALKFKDAS